MLFKKQIIQSPLTIEEFTERLTTLDVFTGIIGENCFEVREEKFFCNKMLFPIINGKMVENDDATFITLSFAVCKMEKISAVAFLILVLLFTIVLGIVTNDVLVLLVLLLWAGLIAVISILEYRFYCRRALRKILRLTNSKIVNNK